MKKWMMFVLCAVSFMHAQELPKVTRLVNFTDIDLEQLNAISSGAFPEVAIRFEKGTQMPRQFICKHKLLSAALDIPLTVVVEQACYVRCIGKKVFLSTDMKNWEKSTKFFQRQFENQQMNTNISINQSHSKVEINLEDAIDQNDFFETKY